jgi:hypothetical protein
MRRIAVLIAVCAAWLAAGVALASRPRIPAHNFAVGRLPLACIGGKTSAGCINGAVYWLDRARASLGQRPYRLPSNFAGLPPAEQAFILTNLDRIQYGLHPIPGLTRQLDSWAMAGVLHRADPTARSSDFHAVGTWAGGFPNIVVSYEEWMYNDGYGGGNLDCTSPHAAGCWSHRRTVLSSFGARARTAMGAAAGYDRQGERSYAMILGKGTRGFPPTYYYTWSQAVAAGAGTNNYVVHRPPSVALALRSHGLKLVALIAAPRRALARCSVSKHRHRRWRLYQSFRCYPGRQVVGETSPGRYLFRLNAKGRILTRYVILRRL